MFERNQLKTLETSKNKTKRSRSKKSENLENDNYHIQSLSKNFRLGKNIRQQDAQDKFNSFSVTRYTVSNYPNTNKVLQKNEISYQNLEITENKTTNKVKKQDNIQKLRTLLPDFLKAKLPSDLSKLYKIVNKIDRYLHKLPKKQIGQSFVNLRTYLQKTHDIQLTLTQLYQINYVMPACYKFFEDPLHNLVIQSSNRDSIYVRQHNFRKALYKIHLQMVKSGKEDQPIKIKEPNKTKIKYFYPPKKFNKIQHSQHSQVPKQFVAKILSQIKQKELQQQNLAQQLFFPKEQEQSLKQIRQAIIKIYGERKVSNIYKVTLLSLINQATTLDFNLIRKGLQQLINKNQQLSEIVMQGRTIVNYQEYLQPLNKIIIQ